MPKPFLHQPVLLPKVLDALNLQPNGIYVDCTFGRGGHSQAILNRLGTTGQILAFDQDPEAVQAAQALCLTDPRLSVVHSTFTQLTQQVEKRGWLGKVNGVLLDLGVSSPQLDSPTRGFSFMHDGPLDMRMNPLSGKSVEEWLSSATVFEIAEVLKIYGEEHQAQRIAQAIVLARQQTKLKTTHQLVNIIIKACPPLMFVTRLIRREKNTQRRALFKHYAFLLTMNLSNCNKFYHKR